MQIRQSRSDQTVDLALTVLSVPRSLDTHGLAVTLFSQLRGVVLVGRNQTVRANEEHLDRILSENGSSQGQNLALAVLFMPTLLDKRGLATTLYSRLFWS